MNDGSIKVVDIAWLEYFLPVVFSKKHGPQLLLNNEEWPQRPWVPTSKESDEYVDIDRFCREVVNVSLNAVVADVTSGAVMANDARVWQRNWRHCGGIFL